MNAPARFAKAWREHAENGRPITPGDAVQARRTPQDAPIPAAEDQIGADQANRAPDTVPVVPLRSPSGLAARDDDTTTLQAPTNHQLSQQVDR